jgi:hypothetical protein
VTRNARSRQEAGISNRPTTHSPLKSVCVRF